MGWTIDNIVRFMGGYCDRSVIESNKKAMNDLYNLEQDLLKDNAFLYDALVYELFNHEYSYTRDLEPTISALGLDLMKLSPCQMKIVDKAKYYVLSTSID